VYPTVLERTTTRDAGDHAGPLFFRDPSPTGEREHNGRRTTPIPSTGEGEHKVRPCGRSPFIAIIVSPLHHIVPAVLLIAFIAIAPRPCRAVQPQEWEITKEDYFQQLAKRLQGLADDNWQVSLHFADKIRGWDGTTLARIVRFDHRTLKMKVLDKELPASFNIILADIRETLTSDARLCRREEAEQFDECMGSDGTYLWFCSPGPYGALEPEKWQALVRSIRNQYTIPKPAEGVQARVDGAKNIFAVGEPIELRASVRNVGGRPIAAATPLKSDAFSVRSIDGGADVPPGAAWRTGTGGAMQPWEELAQTVDLRRSYGITKPGRFTVGLRYRLRDGAAAAESQQMNVRVVPHDFLTLRLKRAEGKDAFRRGDKVMVELSLVKGYADTANLTDLTVTFRADPRGGGIASGLRGWPGSDPGETRKEQSPLPVSLQMGRGAKAFRYDLGMAKWARVVGSPALRVALWDYAQLGEFWEIRTECSGNAGGDKFNVISNPIRVRIMKK